jgi:hypothetical protein
MLRVFDVLLVDEHPTSNVPTTGPLSPALSPEYRGEGVSPGAPPWYTESNAALGAFDP